MTGMLSPVPTDRRRRRLINLAAGLVLFGVSVAMMLSAELGVDSWDVLHQSIATRLRVPFGWVVNGVALVVLVAWIPLRQRPGVGTFANALTVGMVADATLTFFSRPEALSSRFIMLTAGIVLNGFATGLYISAGLGPGPRDGLMTGMAARTRRSIRLVRTLIELSVLSLGWALGGPIGLGTLLYAMSIGPLTQYFLTRLAIEPASVRRHLRRGAHRPGRSAPARPALEQC